MAKYNVQDKIDALIEQAEDLVASDMLDAFRQRLLQQFKLRKGVIEDWQDLNETELEKISNRLRVIADKSDWSVSNLMDMALVCALVWNEKINGE